MPAPPTIALLRNVLRESSIVSSNRFIRNW
jgi:hypothetical protein